MPRRRRQSLYQAVACDNSGNPIANQNISLRFIIHDATAAGTVVYQETQSKTTNLLGLFTANIGEGTVVSGTFSTIDWSRGSKFIQMEMDAAGGQAKITGGTTGAGKVLTSDATGLASWQLVKTYDANYSFVGMGCQSWMSKNLDVATYRNGDPIPKVTDDATWAALTTGAYCYYNNDSATYAAIYGKLYNWYAVNDSRGLAPEGGHAPTDFEWTILENALGGSSVAGGALKEIGTSHWTTPNTNAINISGFAGLPGGYRNDSCH